jgi:hypothetical protein
MFLEKRQVCGPYGCAYQLNYVSQMAETECQGFEIQLGD